MKVASLLQSGHKIRAVACFVAVLMVPPRFRGKCSIIRGRFLQYSLISASPLQRSDDEPEAVLEGRLLRYPGRAAVGRVV